MRLAAALAALLVAGCATERPHTMSFAEAGIPLQVGPAPPPRQAEPRSPAAQVKKVARRRPAPEAWRWPIDPVFVTSDFGWRKHPILGRDKPHSGLDLGAVLGQPVYAAAPGVVVFAGERGPLGLTVELSHDDGVVTVYGHLSDILVEEGDRIRGGRRIGLAGESGLATGPHLHFEIRSRGRPLDPQDVLPNLGTGGTDPAASARGAPAEPSGGLARRRPGAS